MAGARAAQGKRWRRRQYELDGIHCSARGTAEVDLTAVVAGIARRETIDAAELEADRQRNETIITAMREYDGPLNRKGRPRMRPFRRHLEAYDVGYVSRGERNELYEDWRLNDARWTWP